MNKESDENVTKMPGIFYYQSEHALKKHFFSVAVPTHQVAEAKTAFTDLRERSFVLQFPIHGRFTKQLVPIRSGSFEEPLHFRRSLLLHAVSAESAHLQS